MKAPSEAIELPFEMVVNKGVVPVLVWGLGHP